MKRYLFLLLALLGLTLSSQAQKQYSNLPTVYITTSGSTAITSKKTFVNSTWTMVDGTKKEVYSNVQIRCRGNSTYNNTSAKDKPAYRMKFSKAVALLGDKSVTDRNWVLMANHFDKSLIRNALTTDVMGRFCGMEFNPGALFVDVVINGTYMGNYQITDHPDVESGRLDIETPGDETTPSEGFFLEADGWKDHKYITTTRESVPIRIHKPKDGEITDAQANYVKTWMDAFETALYSADFRDKDKGYRKLVDSVSLANLYICTEMSANYDGFWSTYLYKRPNDLKLYFGPLWDYDIAYNNDTRGNNTTQRLICDINTGVCRQWFLRMWKDPWFCQLINRRYKELRQAGIEQHLLHAVDSLGAHIAQSAKLNHDKYGINKKVYNETVMHNTYQEYLDDLKQFITDHLAFLDTEFPQRATEADDVAQEFQVSANYFYRVKSVGVGLMFDVMDEGLTAGTQTCLWNADDTRRTQDWAIRQVGDAYQFINRASGLALFAPNGDLNTRLTLAEPDATDEAQLWTISLASEENSYYNIINKKYTRTANVSGGGNTNGTALICWESNEKNRTSGNRQWIIKPSEFNADEVWSIGDIYEVLGQDIAKYEGLLASVTPGTGAGEVGQAEYKKLSDVITEAKQVVADKKLNVNLTHTYMYYMERAWAAVEASRHAVEEKPIDLDADGNYHLFRTADGDTYATAAADFANNNDTPWGFYRYDVADGTYTKFANFDTNNGKAKATNGKAWYTNNEYCFVTENGNFHPTGSASPAVVFTAPQDGIYYATMTVWRDKDAQANTLYMRSRFLNEQLQCPSSSSMFAKAYGTTEVDGQNGKVPQTLDFYIRLKAGQHFTFEIGDSESGARTHIAELAVATCHSAGDPLTIAEAKAYARFYDAVGDPDEKPINFDAEGNYRLFRTADGDTYATAAADFAENNNAPWGFYRYAVADGTYTKFAKFDTGSGKAKAANGKAWYTNDEYCFVTENGNFHPTGSASPAIAFTAPADGIYFATMTVFRDKATQANTLNMRNRYLAAGQWQCDKDDFLFTKEYGTVAVDGADGRSPQTLDFFIRMKKGGTFTFEIDGSESGARTHIADLAVASVRDTGEPFTEAEAEAYPRFFDTLTVGISEMEGGRLKVVDAAIYDLTGRRIARPATRGIYIQNGRKMVAH
ncbi:MAG: CotH kinase family protein [Bacteroidaceae bacterium]|nr:CotH kinase family protein [Bacteroidaceae bacterium]